MDRNRQDEGTASICQDLLGYLNYSSGAPDAGFLKNLAELYERIDASGSETPAWRALGRVLADHLHALHGVSDAFRQVDQAEMVLKLVFEEALPAYRQFHRDLLFHQSDADLFQPFFIGRMCEAVLQQGGPWHETERIVPAAIQQLNDYIGHRPVAVLQTEQKIQPYAHEWVRPIPLWIRGAGVAPGPYRELVETALAILNTTDPALLFEANFAPEQLDELAFDPRAYDFDHPVNKRPNYLFGQWDMNKLDNAGRSRRFVLQQAALDAMLDRLANHGRLPAGEVLFEEAAVLAGTMLMGSGVSGNRPDAHDSSVTLATLVQKIAVYRDAFYEALLHRLEGKHAKRIQAEAAALHQPFGGARQHFNHYLAHRRALQLQHVHAAQVFASIGYIEAAERQAAIVPVASARMICEMRCRLSTAHLAVDRGNLKAAADQLPVIEDLLHRAIECGAMVDPWNILGFGGQYSLFPAIENSIHDQRIDDLLDMIGDIFMLYIRIHKAAAASGKSTLEESLSKEFAVLAQWWDQFASTELDSVDGLSGQAALESAKHVAAALRAWHEGGAAAGDLAFWRQHVEQFRTPKAYALVIETLLDRRDPVAAMALLVQWLSQADELPLVEEDYSFHDLALLWMEDLWEKDKGEPSSPKSERSAESDPNAKLSRPERWRLARKFLDYLEANAEDYWRVPTFEMASEAFGFDYASAESQEDEGDEGQGLFGAAYEQVTYRDSTDDGIEGELYDTGENPTDFELVGEAERIIDRLGFLATVAQLWKLCATASRPDDSADRDEALSGWLDQAMKNHGELIELMQAVHRYKIPQPTGSHESLVEYDQRRGVKETLLEEIIEACVETHDAALLIRASMQTPPKLSGADLHEQQIAQVVTAALHGDAAAVRQHWPKFVKMLSKRPLLYVALGRGGDPKQISASRGLQYVLRRLLCYLPRLGLLSETCQLLQTAQYMETAHPVGPGAITEFDRIFDIGCKAVAQCLAVVSSEWSRSKPKRKSRAKSKASLSPSQEIDEPLIGCLEQITEVLLHCWLRHSQGVRLSVLESVANPQRWKQVQEFIERYGGDLFTQRFMNLGNLRGILQQGVAQYLETLRENPDSEEEFRLLAELDAAISLDDAADMLTLILEAVVENYGEYIDYNTITTQSDRGEMLYTLLDFLRLRASYDRLAWNLRPVVIAHEALVRSGRNEAAEIWRQAMTERVAPIADEHLERFERLCKKYGMRLPSIAEHLNERFIRPLEIDQLCALVKPAVDEIRNERPPEALRLLEERIVEFSRLPAGAGFELPGWLDALERELEQIRWPEAIEDQDDAFDALVYLPQVPLTESEVHRQLYEMTVRLARDLFELE